MNATTPKTLLPALGALAAAALLPGCVFDEGLIIENMTGTIVLPRAAATREFACDCTDADNDGLCDESGACPDANPPDTVGGTWEVTDVRNIGPVYVGLYSDVEDANVIANYPHPAVGPIFQDGIQGDTYPYGGTTIGDLRFACFDALTCKLTSGRWESYDAIVEWFNDVLGQPILDADGRQVSNGEYFRQTCFDLMEVTSDQEVLLLPPDRDGDGKITLADLDFVENADGDFEGEFKLWQQDFYWDQSAKNCTPGLDCPAFKVWAFMDGPGRGNSQFITCDDSDNVGFSVEEYNHDFFGGRVQEDVLNKPDSYVGPGDWVSDSFLGKNGFEPGFYEWRNRFDRPVIRLGYEVTE